jgi:hypothetical protein
MKRSNTIKRAGEKLDAQHDFLQNSRLGSLIPNDYVEYRPLIEPRPEEVASAIRLEVVGRILTVMCEPSFALKAWSVFFDLIHP